jgi:hypothetical protein
MFYFIFFSLSILFSRNADPELNTRLASVYAELEAIEADKVTIFLSI